MFRVVVRRVFKATCLLFGCLCLGISLLGTRVEVVGMSMYPTLEDGQSGYMLYDSFWQGSISIGDIVVVEMDSGDVLVKRVVALPGMTVSAVGGILVVDGQGVDESYLDVNYVLGLLSVGVVFMDDFEPVVLGEGEYFVLGDNRPNSSDSRSFGAIRRDQVLSHLVWFY